MRPCGKRCSFLVKLHVFERGRFLGSNLSLPKGRKNISDFWFLVIVIIIAKSGCFPKTHQVGYLLETYVSKLPCSRFAYAGVINPEFRPSLFAMLLYFTSRIPTRLLAVAPLSDSAPLGDLIG